MPRTTGSRHPAAASRTPLPRSAVVRFHGDLDDLLAPDRRGGPLVHAFDGTPSVKDVIESLGIPHTEVGSITVNDAPVGFAHHLSDGDRVDVFPPPGSTGTDGDGPSGPPDETVQPQDRPGAIPLAPPVPRPPRFLLDTHLGRLAAYLRMLGFDAAYANHADDEDLARRSADEGRILLTRDRGLLRRSIVRLGYLLRSDDPHRQLVEVARRFDLPSGASPFTRCIRCNGRIEPVERDEVAARLQPKTLRYYDTFGRCDTCGEIFWKGSHYAHMQRLVERALDRRTWNPVGVLPAQGRSGS